MARSIVAICMPGQGHVQRVLPVVELLTARQQVVHVMAEATAAEAIERVGGRFFDLFGKYPVAAADATTIPVASRYVSFAGKYLDALIEEVKAFDPGLIVYDTFAVVGPPIARHLDIPYVNVCANHAAVPARLKEARQRESNIAISPECWEAIRKLQDHGMSDANPFSYFEMQSPFLNLYSEPSEFLSEADRAVFEPLAFFGSLAPALRESEATDVEVFPRSRSGLRIYVSFGTVIWWYYADLATAALRLISDMLGDLDVNAVISLGRHPMDDATRATLTRPNVQVVDYTNQWAALREADAFITHNGLNSTHEAIFHGVPMVSHPFFGDQPALARRCQDLGLAVPLIEEPRSKFRRDAVQLAIWRLSQDEDVFAERLAEAKSWEMRTIAGREAIIDRVLGLMS